MKDEIVICVFHFNRGEYLENLVTSAERYFPDIPLIIFDDNSRDRKSRVILDRLSKTYEIQLGSLIAEEPPKVGGLVGNMNSALRLAMKRKFKYAVMIQEDMQFVRGISKKMFHQIEKGFSHENASFVLSGSFFKGKRSSKTHEKFVEVSDGIYHPKILPNEKKMRDQTQAFADTGIYSLKLFDEQMQTLKASERVNDKFMRSQNKVLACMGEPIMHFLPMPKTYRSKKRRLSIRVIDWFTGAGVHPIELIPDGKLKKRLTPPYAIEELKVPSLPNLKIWTFRSGSKNLMVHGGWRAKLFKYMPKNLNNG